MTSPAAFLAAARADLGTTENPPGSNRNHIVTWYNEHVAKIGAGPWCDMSVSYWAAKAGIASIVGQYAYCPAHVNFFRERGRLVSPENIQPGDVVFYNFDGGRSPQHVEVAASRPNSNGNFSTIGGNTSSGNAGSQDNGGGVFARTRNVRQVVAVGRPDWSKVAGKPSPVAVKPKAAKPRPKPKTVLDVDGDLGPKTIARWQQVMGTPVDGRLSKPSMLIAAVQHRLKVKESGVLDKVTVKALQRYLGTTVDGVISKPDSQMVRALQKRLNSGKF